MMETVELRVLKLFREIADVELVIDRERIEVHAQGLIAVDVSGPDTEPAAFFDAFNVNDGVHGLESTSGARFGVVGEGGLTGFLGELRHGIPP
jgi:hypothetical protein